MTVDFDYIEQLLMRGQPNGKEIAKAVKKAQKLPDAGDGGHVIAPWPKASTIPNTTKADWGQAKLKQVKIKSLLATTMRLDRQNLIWHLRNPGLSKFKGKYNTHPQVAKTKEGRVIVDGHHRLAALMMLGVKKEQVWHLKA